MVLDGCRKGHVRCCWISFAEVHGDAMMAYYPFSSGFRSDARWPHDDV